MEWRWAWLGRGESWMGEQRKRAQTSDEQERMGSGDNDLGGRRWVRFLRGRRMSSGWRLECEGISSQRGCRIRTSAHLGMEGKRAGKNESGELLDPSDGRPHISYRPWPLKSVRYTSSGGY